MKSNKKNNGMNKGRIPNKPAWTTCNIRQGTPKQLPENTTKYAPAIQRISHGIALWLAAFALIPTAAHAATRSKQDNTDNLNLASSWDTLPGAADIAQWTNTVTGANTTVLGADLSWAGIKIASPGGLVTINSGNTLTIGTSGIDLSAATQDLTLNSGLTLRNNGQQSWTAAAGRTLNVAGTFTHTGAVVSFTNFNAAATLSGLANDASGILGPWATTGSGTALNYVTSTSGAISTYTGQTSATAADLSNVLDPNVNYTFATGAPLTGPITANTLRFTGGTGSTLDNAGNTITLNGLLCNGTGNLTISGAGNLVIGSTKELVVIWTKSFSKITCPVMDNPAGPSAVTIILPQECTFGGTTASAYSGGTTVSSCAGSGEIKLNTTLYGFGTGPVTINGNIRVLCANQSNTLTLNGGTLVGGGTWAGPVTLAADTTLPSQIANGNITLSNTVSGPGNLTWGRTGTPTLTLGGTNTYTGSTSINFGTLKLGSNYAIPSGGGKGNVTVTGALDLNAYCPAINGLSGAGTVDNKVAGTPTLTVGDNDQTSTFSGVIKNTAGSLSLCKIGSGTLTLSGANTYTGNTALSAGTLSLSPTDASGHLADGADVYLTTGAFLDLSTSGAVDTIRSLYIDGVPQAAGVWAASAGAGVDHVSTLITGTGKLSVTELAVGATYSISGTVTENGVGLAGVTVSDGTRTSDPTGVDGVYTIANVPDGITYTVTPSKSGYTFTPANLSLMLSGANQTGNHFTATAASSTPYDTWKAGPFANAFTETNPTDDPDGDGMTNQEEFAFGLDPTTGASVNPVTPLIGTQFTYTRWAASNLAYTVEFSTDLAGWDTASTTDDGGGAVDANGVQIVKVTVTNAAVDGKLFVRVRAEE